MVPVAAASASVAFSGVAGSAGALTVPLTVSVSVALVDNCRPSGVTVKLAVPV